MDWKEYVDKTFVCAVYPKEYELQYLLLGAVNELAELVQKMSVILPAGDVGDALVEFAAKSDEYSKLKKAVRGDYAMPVKIHEERIRLEKDAEDAFAQELGDVLWYLGQLSRVLNRFDVLELNTTKLLDRKDRGVLKGSGDKR